MDIECKLKREGGSHVPLGTTTYHFAPREDGAHVATVASAEHQDIFLGIPEAYRMYRGKADAPAAPVNAKAAPAPAPEDPKPDASPEIVLCSSEHPASFEINGKTYALGDVVALAHAASGLDAAEWNELEESSRADLIDEQLDKLQADTNGDGQVDPKEERAALAIQYEDKFGTKPHPNTSIATLRKKLAEG